MNEHCSRCGGTGMDDAPNSIPAPAPLSAAPTSFLQLVHVLANRAQPRSVVKMAAVAGVSVFVGRSIFSRWEGAALAEQLLYLALFTLCMICLGWLEVRLGQKR